MEPNLRLVSIFRSLTIVRTTRLCRVLILFCLLFINALKPHSAKSFEYKDTTNARLKVSEIVKPNAGEKDKRSAHPAGQAMLPGSMKLPATDA